MKRLVLLAALVPSTAHAFGVAVPEEGCVQIVRQSVELTVHGARASSATTLELHLDKATRLTLLAETTAATLDGEALALAPLDEAEGWAEVLRLATTRPGLLALGPRIRARTTSTLEPGRHELVFRSAPEVLTGPTPAIAAPLRHFGTACHTPRSEVRAAVEWPEPIGAVITPYHERTVTRTAGGVEVSAHAPEGQQGQDFVLLLATSEDPVAARAMSYRDAQCDAEAPGYLLLGAGTAVTEAKEAGAKDLVLVIDTSGSMSGSKIEQVKTGLLHILSNLGPDDRYELVSFSNVASALFGALVPASDREKLELARSYAQRLSADGGTIIEGGLELGFRALEGADGPRPKLVLFLTDGLATTGLTDADQLVSQAVSRNTREARVFSFGIGDSVNTRLLDELPRRTGGRAHYIRTGDDIRAALAEFYRSVQAPIATGLALRANQMLLDSQYPSMLPDLYAGGELSALARYLPSASASLALEGRLESGAFASSVRGGVALHDVDAPYVPRLWASRRLGELLYQARENRGEQGTVDEIRALALRFGFVTMFTPFTDGDVSYRNPTAEHSGRDAVSTSGYTNSLSENGNAGAYVGEETRVAIRQAHDRTFLKRGRVWTDSRVPEGANPALSLRFGGEGWRALASSSVLARELLAVGDEVVFEWNCQVVRVSAEEGLADGPLPAGFAVPGVAVRVPSMPSALPEIAAGCTAAGRGLGLPILALLAVALVRRRRE